MRRRFPTATTIWQGLRHRSRWHGHGGARWLHGGHLGGGWPVTLRSGAVVLRPLRCSDEDDWIVLRQRNQDWLARWEATRPPGSPEKAPTFTQMVRRNQRRARHGEILPWALVWDDGWPDHPVRNPYELPITGQVTVFDISYGAALSCSVGYWISADHAGRGAVPTAVAMTCDHCFGALGMHRIEICVRPENVKSLRVVEKIGMTEEGLRHQYLHIDGSWRDHRVFRMFPDDHPQGVLHDLQRNFPAPGMSCGSTASRL